MTQHFSDEYSLESIESTISQSEIDELRNTITHLHSQLLRGDVCDGLSMLKVSKAHKILKDLKSSVH